jgi:hypothetical protein
VRPTGDGGHGEETFDEYQARGHAQRGSLRGKLGLRAGDGIDLNDAINGVPLMPPDHYKTYPRSYLNALDKMLHRRDPDETISPCDWLRDDSEHGLRATLKRIAELLANGKFLY